MTVPMIPIAPVVPVVMVAVPMATFPTVVERKIVLAPVAAPMVANPVGGAEAVTIFPTSGPIALIADSSVAAPPPRLIFAIDKLAVTEISVAAKVSPTIVAT